MKTGVSLRPCKSPTYIRSSAVGRSAGSELTSATEKKKQTSERERLFASSNVDVGVCLRGVPTPADRGTLYGGGVFVCGFV